MDVLSESGPELDRKVFESLSMPFPCRPSTDVRGAFALAELTQLFGGDSTYALWQNFRQDRGRYWAVIDWTEKTDDVFQEIARGRTPALAICAAIMRLHGETTKARD